MCVLYLSILLSRTHAMLEYLIILLYSGFSTLSTHIRRILNEKKTRNNTNGLVVTAVAMKFTVYVIEYYAGCVFKK